MFCVDVVGDRIIASGKSTSSDGGFPFNGALTAPIAKYTISYVFDSESTSKLQDLYVIPDNTLKLSLSTNQIIFEGFSYTESSEKLNALEIIVSSSLPYDINVSIESDIIGANYGQKIDNSLINIKTDSDTSYQTFSESITKLNLIRNHVSDNDVVHGIDIKLTGKKINKVDVYKTTLKLNKFVVYIIIKQ